MFSAASPDSAAENASTRDIACKRRVHRLAVAADFDLAQRVLQLAQAAGRDGVHLAGHAVAQQPGHARHPAEHGVDRAPAPGGAQQRLGQSGGAQAGDGLGVQQAGLGQAVDQHLQLRHLVRRRGGATDTANA